MPVVASVHARTAQRAAELIQADWAKVGVTANIVTRRLGRSTSKTAKPVDRDGAVIQIGWTGDNGDPDNFFATLFSLRGRRRVGNRSQLVQQGLRRADIQKAKTTSDMAERTKLYEQAQVIFAKDSARRSLLAHSQVYVMPMQEGHGLRPWIRSASTASTTSTSPNKQIAMGGARQRRAVLLSEPCSVSSSTSLP